MKNRIYLAKELIKIAIGLLIGYGSISSKESWDKKHRLTIIIDLER